MEYILKTALTVWLITAVYCFARFLFAVVDIAANNYLTKKKKP